MTRTSAKSWSRRCHIEPEVLKSCKSGNTHSCLDNTILPFINDNRKHQGIYLTASTKVRPFNLRNRHDAPPGSREPLQKARRAPGLKREYPQVQTIVLNPNSEKLRGLPVSSPRKRHYLRHHEVFASFQSLNRMTPALSLGIKPGEFLIRGGYI